MVAAVAAILGLGALKLYSSPWDVETTIRHIAAAPNCSAARAVGLAPSLRGAPGYYSSHDRDRDGIACEVYRGASRFTR